MNYCHYFDNLSLPLSGVLMSFMLHDIVGWKPAFEQILLSARQSPLNLGALTTKKMTPTIKKEESNTSMDILDTMDIEGKLCACEVNRTSICFD
jgi:hypothetical protein